MPLSPGSRIQSDTGTAGVSGAGSATANVTLPDPTQPGSTVLVIMSAAGIPIPDGWARDQINTIVVQVFRRPQPDGGESSWTFSSGAAILWAWYVEEIAGIDAVDPVDSTATGTTGVVASTVSSGTTGTTVSADTAVLAVFHGTKGSGGQGAFPAGRSYDSGFSDLAYVPNGTGNSASDLFLAAAELYPGATGTFSTTMTYDTTGGGSITGLPSYGLIVAYRATGQSLPDGGLLAAAAPP